VRDNRDGREVRDSRDSRDAFGGEAAYRGPQVIELTGGDAHALDDLAGRDVADAVAAILSTFDRNAGAVSLRQIAETAQRRGRLAGDVQLVQSQVAAAVRADNARRITAGQRPRFRFAGGRVALTDWLLSGELARLEQEALAAVERYREAARRAFARKLGELPGHAFVEVCVLALERIGVGQLRAVRRAGASGGETHFGGVLRMAAEELRLAVVIRRDGREVGRERVTELRGSLHHYGPAISGLVLTAGQILSGAREEASIPGTAPISLYDGLAVARLCEENDVAVLRARMPIAIPDVDLLEALRAS
jgi:restriction endonuclease Mrr